MDVQLKKGILDICILKCLEKKDSYGYEIIKILEEYIGISESTLYPILRRLENNSCLSTYNEEHNGRLRKYYRLEKEGKKRVLEFKEEWKEIQKIYNFIMEDSNEKS